MLRAANLASYFSITKVVIFITFLVYVMVGNTIRASRVFVTVALYGGMRVTVTLFFPNALEKLFESLVSVQRIQVRAGAPVVFYFFPTRCEVDWPSGAVY